jgi:hypothetical protein
MARFRGPVGFADTAETAPGVYEEKITERVYQGDVVQNRRLIRSGEQVNPVVTSGNAISIVADAQAYEQYLAIRYVEWAGVRWTVQDVEVKRPRLLLRLGEVYDGLTADSSGAP